MDFISIIRFVATILITNSHFDSLYPPAYSVLSTGGMIGNALFFFCSGYTLYLSLSKTKMNGFQWLLKRLIRLYPSIWLFRIFSWLLLGGTLSWINIIIPGYWFLNAIIIFYVVFYFVIKYCSKHIIWIMVGLIIPFISVFFLQIDRAPKYIMDDTSNYLCLHWFYLFAIMLFGAYLAKRKNIIISNNLDYIKLLISVVLYYGYKGILIKYGLWTPQLLYPLFLMPVVYYTYKVSNHIAQAKILKIKPIQSSVFYISNLTLDIYIVQFACIKFAKIYQFPIGFLVAIGLIAVSAMLLNYLSKHIVNFINAKLQLNKKEISK